jgi:hypothetical protein
MRQLELLQCRQRTTDIRLRQLVEPQRSGERLLVRYNAKLRSSYVVAYRQQCIVEDSSDWGPLHGRSLYNDKKNRCIADHKGTQLNIEHTTVDGLSGCTRT